MFQTMLKINIVTQLRGLDRNQHCIGGAKGEFNQF